MLPVPPRPHDEPFGSPYGTGFSADSAQSAQSADGPEVGRFAQGSGISRWAVSRYLIGRVILDRVSLGLLVLAAVLLAGAVAIGVTTGLTAPAVLLGVVAAAVALMRLALRAVLRRLTAVAALAPVDRDRVDRLVRDARHDVLAELRRVGLPGRSVTLPLLAVRLLGRRRAETVTRLRDVDVDRAVSPARRDELHMIIESAAGSGRA